MKILSKKASLGHKVTARCLIAAVGILIVFILADLLLIYMEDKNYRDKMSIIGSMLAAQDNEDNLLTASKLLKDTVNDEQYGWEILDRYGYNSVYDNSYKLKFRSNVFVIVSLSALLYFIIIISMIALAGLFARDRKTELKRLEEALIELRNGMYTAKKPDIGRMDSGLDGIYSRIEELSDYLLLTHERIMKEKEETKALVTDISHQLKTPVAALRTCFEILQQNNLSIDEKSEFTERYKLQMEGLENLLEALINISRMETGMIQIKREDEYIYDTLVAAINRVFLKAESKMIDIGMEVDESLQKLKIKHDKKWLCEAFINLLDNAIKYSLPNTEITIRMYMLTSFLKIELEDQGIGIAKEEYNYIFKRFYRGKNDFVKSQSGSGVGLYLTREIIHRHKGTISVSSNNKTDKTGSIFSIQLPYKD